MTLARGRPARGLGLSSAALADWPPRQLLVLAVAVALVAFELVYPTFLTPHSPRQPLSYSLVIAAVGAAWLAVGIGAWHGRPRNRVGLLMVAVGFGWLSYQLSWLPGPLAWMWTYFTNDLELPFLVWLALIYPTGRLFNSGERAVIAAAWLLWAWPQGVSLLMDDPQAHCPGSDCPANLLLLRHDDVLQQALIRPSQVAALLVAAVVIALIFVHWRRATNRGRRSVLPLVWLSGPPAVWFALDIGGRLNLIAAPTWIWPWFNLALVSIPLGYVYMRLLDRWDRGAVGDLIVGLGTRWQPNELRQVLARTLKDPTLEVAYWLPEERRFADLDGQEVAIPKVGDPRRASTVLERAGEPLAVIVHDAAVADDPKLMAAAAAAVTMAVENERLHALVRAQLDEVRASRARIVAAQDAERRRLERDLHDGAQQRLVTLALALGEARSHVAEGSDPSLRSALETASDEVGAALAELRELAVGIHPAILTRAGLVAAVRSLGERAQLPVIVEADDIGRLDPSLEAAAYFVVSEALTNIAKHAQATEAKIRLSRTAKDLRIEVADDGVGGADESLGSGLRGLADRVRAVDGLLTVKSPVKKGTSLVVEIPCGSS
jgi:signal transduction histidine kinase